MASSKVSNSDDSNKWSLYTEHLLYASCVGWCVGISFKENPKSAALAFTGGASSVYIANYFSSNLSSQSKNSKLLHAGGFLSLTGVTWCLKKAFDEHAKVAGKACLGGALSACITKSFIDKTASAIVKGGSKFAAMKKISSASIMFHSRSNTGIDLDYEIKRIGEELKGICKEFYALRHG